MSEFNPHVHTCVFSKTDHGEPGNENLIHGSPVCDDCSVMVDRIAPCTTMHADPEHDSKVARLDQLRALIDRVYLEYDSDKALREAHALLALLRAQVLS